MFRPDVCSKGEDIEHFTSCRGRACAEQLAVMRTRKSYSINDFALYPSTLGEVYVSLTQVQGRWARYRQDRQNDCHSHRRGQNYEGNLSGEAVVSLHHHPISRTRSLTKCFAQWDELIGCNHPTRGFIGPDLRHSFTGWRCVYWYRAVTAAKLCCLCFEDIKVDVLI